VTELVNFFGEFSGSYHFGS